MVLPCALLLIYTPISAKYLIGKSSYGVGGCQSSICHSVRRQGARLSMVRHARTG